MARVFEEGIENFPRHQCHPCRLLSETGASRVIFEVAQRQDWVLLVSPWVLRETRLNLADKPASAIHAWVELRRLVNVEDDELIFDWPVAFAASKDKPVLFSALASADLLLTLDRHDFRDLLGKQIYGLKVLTPGEFLRAEREAGRL